MSDFSNVVAKAKADLITHGEDLSGDAGAFKICLVAARRIPGGGLKQKLAGTNIFGCSTKSIMLRTPDADGNNDFEVLVSPGTTNGPEWHGFNIPESVWVDPHRADLPTRPWEAAPAPAPGPAPAPPPSPPPPVISPSQIDALVADLDTLIRVVSDARDDLRAANAKLQTLIDGGIRVHF